MNFKERAREEGNAFTSVSRIKEPVLVNVVSDALLSRAFQTGAEWGMRQAVEQLRKKPYEGSWTEVKEARQMADWLLEKAGMVNE